MKNKLLLAIFSMVIVMPCFVDASSANGWVEGHEVSSSQYIKNFCANDPNCHEKFACDYTGNPEFLRFGYGFSFDDRFYAGNQSRRVKNFYAGFIEPIDYNVGDNPEFEWTDEIKSSNKVEAGKNKLIIKSSRGYRIYRHPTQRTQNTSYDFMVKYVVEYANDGGSNATRYQHTECYPYIISWCGDGVKDTPSAALGDMREAEECDEGENNGKPGSSCTIDCKKITVKEPKCSSDYDAHTKYTNLDSTPWLKSTDKLCEEGDVDTFTDTRNEGQPRKFTWYCKNSEGKRTSYVCNATQEWCGDGVYNKDQEECDPKDPQHTNYGSGTYKTCNESCKLVDDEPMCSSKYNGKNVYTNNSSRYLKGIDSENLCDIGKLTLGSFGRIGTPIKFTWGCTNGNKSTTSNACSFNQYRCGDGLVNGGNPNLFINNRPTEACDPNDPNSDGKCGNDCKYIGVACGTDASTTPVYNPNYPTPRITENSKGLCKIGDETGGYKPGTLSGPDSEGNYRWECKNGINDKICVAKDLWCGDGKPQTEYGEECDPNDNRDSSVKGWGEPTLKRCNNQCKIYYVQGPECNSIYNNVTEYTLKSSAPWLTENKQPSLCANGSVGSFKQDDNQHPRKFTWTCKASGQTTGCVAYQEWCGDGVRNNGEECDPKDTVNKDGWGNKGCTNECKAEYNATCGSSYSKKTFYKTDNYTHLNQNTPGLCDTGEVVSFSNNYPNLGLGGHTYTWQCVNGSKVSDLCWANLERCGDGNLQEEYGETCDDGTKNGTKDSTCSKTCQTVSLSCGSGNGGTTYFTEKQTHPWLGNANNEMCPEGYTTGQPSLVGNDMKWTCSNQNGTPITCIAHQKYCGDGIVDKIYGEECEGGDNCNEFCEFKPNPPSSCTQTFEGTLRCGSGYRLPDIYKAGIDTWLYSFDVNFVPGYNIGSKPKFDWTKELRDNNMLVKAGQEMEIIEANPLYVIQNCPEKRSYDNLYMEYTVRTTEENYNGKTVPNSKLTSHKECGNYVITRCGDGVKDEEYGEECDPGSQETVILGNGQICNSECKIVTPPPAVCKSKYNGQTVESITESDKELCETGTYSDFVETSTGWTWKCNNVAGKGTECSATKAAKGDWKIDKELVTKKEVNSGDILEWKITVTAVGGNVKNLEIRDDMPTILSYVKNSVTITNNPDNIKITKETVSNSGTDGKNNVVLFNTQGTLKSGHSIVLTLKTKVNKMPDPEVEYKNVACSKPEDETEWKCEPEPVTAACSSDYYGKTFTNLESSDKLCKAGNITKFTPTTTGWIWECNNKGSLVECYANKKSNPAGEPEIEKTLKNKIIVKKVNQKLTWTVKVTAKGGDITDFKVRDKLPKALKYETFRVVSNEDGLKLSSKPSGPVESGSNNIYTWDVTGTLHQGNELVMEIDTVVVKMPTSKDDYLNIACVEDDGNVDCDDDQPGTAEIEKELQDKKEVTHTGQELDWKVTVTAKGGDIENFEIWDKMPVELKYLGWELDKNNTQNKITVTYDETRSPKASGDVNIHFWNVKGVLYSGNKITMIVKSEVKKMPASGEDILNVACVIQSGNEIDCGEDKPPVPSTKGEPTIKKTLQDKKQVTKTGEELVWEVKVTASGGAISGFEIWDIMPNEIEYVNAKLTGDTHGIKITKQSKTTLTGDHNEKTVHYWSTNGKTLEKGESITMLVYTKVKVMPKAGEDILNVACVVTEETQKCDNDSTNPTEGELVPLKTLKGPKEIVNTGDEVVWSLKVTASGGDVTNFIMTDKMPPVLGYSGYKVNHTGSVKDIIFQGEDKENNKVSWKVEGTLKEGDYVEIYLTTYAKEMPDKEYKNVLCVAPEDNPTNEKCDDKPIHSPDLRIKKTFTDGSTKKTVKIGEEIAYKITFGNSGTASATITSIKDFLPRNIDYIDGSISIKESIYSTGKQVGTGDLGWKGFKIVDGVYIEIYGGMTLKPGDKGEIILTGKVREDFTGNRTNFACIYLDDELVNCDNVIHEIEPGEMSCEKLNIPAGNLPNGGGSKDVTCTASEGVADLITIDCGNGTTITGANKSELTGICTYPSGAKTYNLKCTVKKDGKDYTSTSCDGSVTVNGTSGCFPAGTKVTMADGSKKNIEDVEVGDVVLSYNTDKNINESNIVLKKLVHEDNEHEMYEFTINGNVLKVTDVHRFYVKKSDSSKDYDWIEAKNLKIGDTLLMNDGSLVKIEKINHYPNRETVYNFEVENNHNYFVDMGYLVHNSKGCSGPCCGGGCGPTPDPDLYCEQEKNKTEPDPLCELAQPHCFNTNQGNFSVESGEYLPYYFNIYRDKNNYHYNYKFANGDESCELGDVDLGSMKCKIVVRDPKNKEVYTKDNITCLKLGETRYAGDSLIEKWAEKQDELYHIDVESTVRGRYWPTIDYVKTNDKNSGWTPSENLGEYKFYVYLYEYKQCGDSEEWETIEYPEAGPKSAPGCQSNFVLTDSYTVQKTPSGNLRASTDTLEKFKEVDGDTVKPFSSYLDAITTSVYTPNQKVNDAMDAFIKKYEKLAVNVNTSKFGVSAEVKKVPGKDIYFIKGDATFKQSNGTDSINKPFTIVQTEGSVTIKGNLQHNMMLLTKGDIIFSGDCTTDQTVRGIFYAQGSLTRTGVLHNNNLNNNVWCTNGGLNIKGVLIGNNFNSLMTGSRSHLETWFDDIVTSSKTTKVMNGASVVIEYSPSIFTKSTMPPGAEDFTTALSIYKN